MNFQPSPLSSLDPLDPTPIQLLLKVPVTTAGYCGFSDPSGKITTGFLIHEEENFIAGLPKDISVELRGKIFTQDQHAVLVIMLGIGKEVYETWWNYWAGRAISDRFGDLSVQKDIPVILFGQSMTPRRVIWVNNSLRNLFQDFSRQFQSAPFWTMDAFEAARNQIYKQFPTPQLLWSGLKPSTPPAVGDHLTKNFPGVPADFTALPTSSGQAQTTEPQVLPGSKFLKGRKHYPFLPFARRIGRAAFINWSLVIFLAWVLAMAPFVEPSSKEHDRIIGILSLVTLTLLALLVVKRLRDLGKPGWHFWLSLIPIYNLFLFANLLFKKGIGDPSLVSSRVETVSCPPPQAVTTNTKEEHVPTSSDVSWHASHILIVSKNQEFNPVYQAVKTRMFQTIQRSPKIPVNSNIQIQFLYAEILPKETRAAVEPTVWALQQKYGCRSGNWHVDFYTPASIPFMVVYLE